VAEFAKPCFDFRPTFAAASSAVAILFNREFSSDRILGDWGLAMIPRRDVGLLVFGLNPPGNFHRVKSNQS
jgi:hypothetical protein